MLLFLGLFFSIFFVGICAVSCMTSPPVTPSVSDTFDESSTKEVSSTKKEIIHDFHVYDRSSAQEALEDQEDGTGDASIMVVNTTKRDKDKVQTALCVLPKELPV